MTRNSAEPTLDDVQAEYPHWEIFKGLNGLCYGRRYRTSPPPLVRGEDPADLRDQLNRWEGNHQ